VLTGGNNYMKASKASLRLLSKQFKKLKIKEASKVTNPRAREGMNCSPLIELKEKTSLTRTP
jgi:hypothetical protein